MIFDKNKIKKILIMRSDGIGDFILSLPALQALRNAYPDAYIALFTCNWQEALAKNTRLFDTIIIWDNSKNYYLTSPTRFKYLSFRMLRYISLLKSFNFDLAIDFKDDPRNRIIMRASGIKFRLGFDKGWSRFILTHPIVYKEGMHKSLLYTRLIAGLIDLDSITPYTFVFLEEDKRQAENFLIKEGISKEDKIIIIHPVARWPAKTWSQEKFAQLSDRLLSLAGVRVIFIGAAEDLPEIQKIKSIMLRKPIISAGILDFLKTAALIQGARVFVGNDAAPMHMAGILNIPTIGLFGPTDPKISSPQGTRSKVLRKIAQRCSGCFRKNIGRCIEPEDFCMDKISVDEVFNLCVTELE